MFPVVCCLVATVCCLSVHKPSVGILVTTVAAFGLGMLAGVVASTRRHKARALRTESPPPFSTNLNYSQPPLASPAVSPRSIEGALTPPPTPLLRQEVAVLRAKGVTRWQGTSLPAALDEDSYLLELCRKHAARDPTWAERKLNQAIDYRLNLLLPTDCGLSTRDSLPAAPASTHSAIRSVSGVVPVLVRGSRPEPLLSDAALTEAGRVLRSACVYWRGVDAKGWPVMWCYSGRLDFRHAGLDAAAWGRAIASLVEIGMIGARARTLLSGRTGVAHDVIRFYYIECSDELRFSRMPIVNSLAVRALCLRPMDANLDPNSPSPQTSFFELF